MNDHNLDDLIIGEPHGGGGKSKSLLSLIALVLIILIVGVLLAKLIFSGPEELGETETTELTGVVQPQAKKPAGQTSLAKAKPVEAIPDELKPITQETLPESDELQPIAPRPKPKPVAKAKPTPAKKPAPKVQSKPKPKPKPKPAQLFEKKPKAQTPAATAKRAYYIQLGSFKRPPEQKFLDRIKAAGYKPIIVKSGKMIKVRIGTYPSYGEAKAKLPQIKEQLGIDGFVVRKK